MQSQVDVLLSGVGKVGKANTGDDTGCGVGQEAVSLCQVRVYRDDHYGSGSVHVQTLSCRSSQ